MRQYGSLTKISTRLECALAPMFDIRDRWLFKNLKGGLKLVHRCKNIIVRGRGRSDSNMHGNKEWAYITDLKALAKELIYSLTQ